MFPKHPVQSSCWISLATEVEAFCFGFCFVLGGRPLQGGPPSPHPSKWGEMGPLYMAKRVCLVLFHLTYRSYDSPHLGTLIRCPLCSFPVIPSLQHRCFFQDSKAPPIRLVTFGSSGLDSPISPAKNIQTPKNWGGIYLNHQTSPEVRAFLGVPNIDRSILAFGK